MPHEQATGENLPCLSLAVPLNQEELQICEMICLCVSAEEGWRVGGQVVIPPLLITILLRVSTKVFWSILWFISSSHPENKYRIAQADCLIPLPIFQRM